MTETKRANRSLTDLMATLHDEHVCLREFCKLYDAGQLIMAKKIALSLKILLHDAKNNKSNSKSILSQLAVKDTIKFLDTAHPREENLMQWSGLTIIGLTNIDDQVLPYNGKKRLYI